MEKPLFEGQPPLLVVPLAIVLALSFKYSPTRPRADDQRGQEAATMVGKTHVPIIFSFLSLCCVLWLYMGHNEQPLTLGTSLVPFPGGSGNSFLALASSLIFADATTLLAQYMIADGVISKVSQGKYRKSLLVLIVLDLGIFVCNFGLMYIHLLWPGLTVMQYIDDIMWGQALGFCFDILAAVALRHLDTQGTDDYRNPKIARLSSIAYGGCASELVLLSLPSICTLFSMWARDGWFDGIMRLGTTLFIGNMRLVVFFLMFRVIEEDAQEGLNAYQVILARRWNAFA